MKCTLGSTKLETLPQWAVHNAQKDNNTTKIQEFEKRFWGCECKVQVVYKLHTIVVAHLSSRSARNTMGTKGTPE